ncbi:uncharacterized protein LOC131312665 [Rhododendron vialii]|uniref:uncharacterized protein LOC131312665 n=1 Tax=Rhododendron vialii TaxID=182163 RepID=UPI00265DAD22|nr:uncharacterized protein LOC131312665 [Rhododendron vialii]
MQANMTEMEIETLSDGVDDLKLSAVVSEVNLVGSNHSLEWLDTGATRHVCADKKMFTTYQSVESGKQLFMGNLSSSKVEGQGKVLLKMTSERVFTLNDVMYAPEIRKNLISSLLLVKNGFRMVFEANKVVLTKSGVYVGWGYMCNGLFKMNVLTKVPASPGINEINTSSALSLSFLNCGMVD